MKHHKKAVLYCRVSSREQEETGYSLPAQEKFLKDYCANNQYQAVKVFSISESAAGRTQRKIFDAMMAYVARERISTIVVETTDRLTRNFRDVPFIDKWVMHDPSHEIHLVKEGCVLDRDSRSHEWFMWRVKVATAEYYVRLLSENVKKGQKEKIAQGWLPTKPPLGYKTIGEKGHKIHVIDEDGAPAIRHMFEWYASGNYSLSMLEDELFKRGLRSRNGKRVLRSRIHMMLQDPFYYGKIRWNGQIYPGAHEPLISKDLFDKVQSLLKRQTKAAGYTKHNPLFKGRIICEHCGGTVTWYLQKGRYYGHCSYHGKSRHCPGKTCLREDRVEKQIVEFFDRIAPKNEAMLQWIEEVIRSQYAEQIERREKEVAQINRALKSVRHKKDAILEAKIIREAPLDFCERKLAEYTAEEEEVERQLVAVSDKHDVYLNLALLTHELAYKAKDIYQKATVEEKRMLFSELFTNFAQDGSTIQPNYTLAAQYLADWMPRLNRDYEPQKSLKNGSTKGKTGHLMPACPELLAWRDVLRTMRWEKLFPYPSVSAPQISSLLSLC